MGWLTVSTITMGLLLAVPNVTGNWLGGWMFRPEREKLYLMKAYLVIASAALSGLPLWG